MKNFSNLAILCSRADWFETYLVGNPADRFSHIKAPIIFAVRAFFSFQNICKVLDCSYMFSSSASGLNLYEPGHEISNNMDFAASKASNQPAHTPSLIRVFASRLNIL